MGFLSGVMDFVNNVDNHLGFNNDPPPKKKKKKPAPAPVTHYPETPPMPNEGTLPNSPSRGYEPDKPAPPQHNPADDFQGLMQAALAQVASQLDPQIGLIHSQEHALDTRYGQDKTTVSSMYDALARELAKRIPETKNRYNADISTISDIYDKAGNRTKAGFDAARNDVNSELKRLGISDAGYAARSGLNLDAANFAGANSSQDAAVESAMRMLRSGAVDSAQSNLSRSRATGDDKLVSLLQAYNDRHGQYDMQEQQLEAQRPALIQQAMSGMQQAALDTAYKNSQIGLNNAKAQAALRPPSEPQATSGFRAAEQMLQSSGVPPEIQSQVMDKLMRSMTTDRDLQYGSNEWRIGNGPDHPDELYKDAKGNPLPVLYDKNHLSAVVNRILQDAKGKDSAFQQALARAAYAYYGR
jgi:hypothetical protein